MKIQLIIPFLLFSCTVLQWREDDIELITKYEADHISTEISYYEIDSLDLGIRTQHVYNDSTNWHLVFLHGSPSSLSAWQGYLMDSLLRTKVNIHAIDRPGYGYSNFGKSMPSINKQSVLISNLINHNKWSNVIVAGSSYGGPIAARLAVLNPHVKGVLMISPAIDPSIEKKVWASRLTQWKLTRWTTPRSYRVAGDEKTVHASELSKLENDWKKVTQPVYHIHGDADDLVPYENVSFTKNQFINHTIITIPNKGHEIAWKHPELMLPHVYELINSLKKHSHLKK